MNLSPEAKYASEAIKKSGNEWDEFLENFSNPNVPIEALTELGQTVATSLQEALLGDIEHARRQIQGALMMERLNLLDAEANSKRGNASKLISKIFGDTSFGETFQAAPESVEALEIARKLEQLHSFLNIQIALRQSRIHRVVYGEKISLPEDDQLKAEILAGCEKHKSELDAAVKQGLIKHYEVLSSDSKLHTREIEIGGEMVPLMQEHDFGFVLPKDIFNAVKHLNSTLTWNGEDDASYEAHKAHSDRFHNITDTAGNWIRDRYGLFGGFTNYDNDEVNQYLLLKSGDALEVLERLVSQSETEHLFTEDEIVNMRRTFLKYQAEFDREARKGSYVQH
jgi:hypothetical protein